MGPSMQYVASVSTETSMHVDGAWPDEAVDVAAGVTAGVEFPAMATLASMAKAMVLAIFMVEAYW